MMENLKNSIHFTGWNDKLWRRKGRKTTDKFCLAVYTLYWYNETEYCQGVVVYVAL